MRYSVRIRPRNVEADRKRVEDSRAGRWWWEQETAKECGLHLSDWHGNDKVVQTMAT